MEFQKLNQKLSRGEINPPELWPRRQKLQSQLLSLPFEFALKTLPLKPGLITIRGARQYGKSTWLEMEIYQSAKKFGPGSTYYLNGDEILSQEALYQNLIELEAAFAKGSPVKRIFIDEITAIQGWENPLKRILDQGHLKDVLIVTTGSKATDIRRGSERLPGRKGTLKRSEYVFLPISYRSFHHLAHKKLGKDTLLAYLLSGGSPIALNTLYQSGNLPDYFIQLIRDWIFGEIVLSGRSRIAIAQILSALVRFGGKSLGYAKLARETGLANNTIASAYIEQLSDLLTVLPAWQWDANKKILLLRKPCRFHFINLAVAMVFHPQAPRTIKEFKALPQETQGTFFEWLVAQEIWRRSVLKQDPNPEAMGFWQSKSHEIDFVTPNQQWIEVKRGRAGPLDFTWFSKCFPKGRLLVVSSHEFETKQVKGVSFENFLLNRPFN